VAQLYHDDDDEQELPSGRSGKWYAVARIVRSVVRFVLVLLLFTNRSPLVCHRNVVVVAGVGAINLLITVLTVG
jgi:hypothetical protein